MVGKVYWLDKFIAWKICWCYVPTLREKGYLKEIIEIFIRGAPITYRLVTDMHILTSGKHSSQNKKIYILPKRAVASHESDRLFRLKKGI